MFFVFVNHEDSTSTINKTPLVIQLEKDHTITHTQNASPLLSKPRQVHQATLRMSAHKQHLRVENTLQHEY